MTAVMIRSKVNADNVTDVEAAVGHVFTALEREQPAGIRYTSSRLADGLTYVAILEIDDGIENPLPGYPEFRAFQESLPGWLSEPPAPEPLTIIGAYRPA